MEHNLTQKGKRGLFFHDEFVERDIFRLASAVSHYWWWSKVSWQPIIRINEWVFHGKRDKNSLQKELWLWKRPVWELNSPNYGLRLNSMPLCASLRYVAETTFAAPFSTEKTLDRVLARCPEGKRSQGFQHVTRRRPFGVRRLEHCIQGVVYGVGRSLHSARWPVQSTWT